jgi:hypothetical protein
MLKRCEDAANENWMKKKIKKQYFWFISAAQQPKKNGFDPTFSRLPCLHTLASLRLAS